MFKQFLVLIFFLSHLNLISQDIDLEQNFDIQYSDSTFNIDLFEIEYPVTLSFDVIDQKKYWKKLLKILTIQITAFLT